MAPSNVESTEPFPVVEANRSRSSSTSSTTSVVYNPQPERRGRARSVSVSGANPLEVPITAAQFQLSRVVASINAQKERERTLEAAQQELHYRERLENRETLPDSGGYRGTSLTRTSSGFCRSPLIRIWLISKLT